MIMVQEEQKFSSYFVAIFVLCSILLWGTTEVQAQEVSGVISRVGDTTHLEFKGRKNWLYETPKKDKNVISILTPPFNSATIVQLQSWNCPLIQKISVNQSAPDNQFEITISLNSDDVESFDYLTDDPSYLIFDFYKQPKPDKETTPVEDKIAKPIQIKSKKNKKKLNIAKLPEKLPPGGDEYKKMQRNPASDEIISASQSPTGMLDLSLPKDKTDAIIFQRGVFDGGDPNYERFRIKDYQVQDNAIIASQQNIYVKFPPLLQKLSRFSELMKNTPEYEINTNGSEESKSASLAITLYKKGRFGALFETLDFISKKYPNSEYDEIIKNVTAEAHIKMYVQDKNEKNYDAFRSIYRYLVATYPNSPLTERNHLLLAYSSLEHHDGAEALRDFKSYLDKYPKSEERDRARLAIGESYALLNKPNDAIKTYQGIIEDSDDKNFGIEAAYRIGDVYMEAEDYKTALDTYKSVQLKYPAHKVVFANAQYNIGECEFWLKKYRESLDSYIDFLKTFPSNRHGGFAQTRIGEILEILGTDERQIMGAFIEGYFRFPESQGSEVSRIRMLSRGLKGMKVREKKIAIDEIDQIVKNSTQPNIAEFSTLLKADGYSSRKEYNDSLNLLLSYYQNNPTTANLQVFKSRIMRNISDLLKEDILNRNFISALNLYGKYSSTWVKKTERIDIPYLQGVAYEQAGVTQEAKRIYEIAYAKIMKLSGTQEENERKVYENLPKIDQIRLRLAAVALEEKKYQDSYKYLSAIKSDLTVEENIEKISIGAIVSEQMGDNKKAISYLEKLIATHSGSVDPIVKAELDLARLYIKEKQYVEAELPLSVVENNYSQNTNLKDEHWLQALELRADLQYKTDKKLAAVETYTKLLDAFETKYPLSAVRYKAGKILFEEGDLRGAEKIWSAFNNDAGDFYKKMAMEKLSQAEWQDTYKKYIERIPAAQDLK